MSKKVVSNQAPVRRAPQQLRSLQKIELMLEAAVQLLEQDDVSALTTNAVAARAGVSIGTLYQYFNDKDALLDALMEREFGSMSSAILDATKPAPTDAPGDRIRRTLRAVVDAYGGRGRVHRRLIAHSLTRTSGSRLPPLLSQLTETLSAKGVVVAGAAPQPLSRAQAFVLTHAIGGVLRSLAASDSAPPVREIEEALVQLALGFVATVGAHQAESRAPGTACCEQVTPVSR
ncbi:TetR/AcrR family transcriptional regulator [Variovorax sp.]|uniref:TetR/AcrR family transcriptional regulator n=1 Tax=Variovorax sp. TaxID=1871043 RepID=UPI002D5DC85A|nr:TetR/AcrR family transcriptional regulator [Variovorax sp.]HYP86145.1 TetR/AcrR family transcriptional regulator [Variovorax sp.]